MNLFLELLLFLGTLLYSYLEAFVKLFVPARRKSLSGELVLITGAGHGVGRATALEFAKRQSRLVLWDINKVTAQPCPASGTSECRADLGQRTRHPHGLPPARCPRPPPGSWGCGAPGEALAPPAAEDAGLWSHSVPLGREGAGRGGRAPAGGREGLGEPLPGLAEEQSCSQRGAGLPSLVLSVASGVLCALPGAVFALRSHQQHRRAGLCVSPAALGQLHV